MNKLVELGYTNEHTYNQYKECFDLFVKDIAPILADKTFYPDDKKIFRALNECPEPKVVILGQDPYFDGSANGLAFDNELSPNRYSPSLKNILKEIAEDLKEEWVDNLISRPIDETDTAPSILKHLPPQGVLLINTALTVEPDKAGSHAEIWKPFTKLLIEKLQNRDNIVWILWGNHAKSYKPLITNTTHKILEGTHPMPLAANRGGFFGGKYFSKANEYLETTNQAKIQW